MGSGQSKGTVSPGRGPQGFYKLAALQWYLEGRSQYGSAAYKDRLHGPRASWRPYPCKMISHPYYFDLRAAERRLAPEPLLWRPSDHGALSHPEEEENHTPFSSGTQSKAEAQKEASSLAVMAKGIQKNIQRYLMGRVQVFDAPHRYRRRILVTGANRGLGYETAASLARLGAEVHLICRSQTAGEAASVAISRLILLDWLERDLREANALFGGYGGDFFGLCVDHAAILHNIQQRRCGPPDQQGIQPPPSASTNPAQNTAETSTGTANAALIDEIMGLVARINDSASRGHGGATAATAGTTATAAAAAVTDASPSNTATTTSQDAAFIAQFRLNFNDHGIQSCNHFRIHSQLLAFIAMLRGSSSNTTDDNNNNNNNNTNNNNDDTATLRSGNLMVRSFFDPAHTRERYQQLLQKIQQSLIVVHGDVDCSDFNSVRRFTDAFNQQYGRADGLIHNAGCMCSTVYEAVYNSTCFPSVLNSGVGGSSAPPTPTAVVAERTMATMLGGTMLMTEGLLPSLAAAYGAQRAWLASAREELIRDDDDDLGRGDDNENDNDDDHHADRNLEGLLLQSAGRHLFSTHAFEVDGARVINVASGGMYPANSPEGDLGFSWCRPLACLPPAATTASTNVVEPLHCGDVPVPGSYDGTLLYALTKRAQVILTELWPLKIRERISASGASIASVVNNSNNSATNNKKKNNSNPIDYHGYLHIAFSSMHPGWSATDGVKTAMPDFSKKEGASLRSQSEGADSIVFLAAAPTRQLHQLHAQFQAQHGIRNPHQEGELEAKTDTTTITTDLFEHTSWNCPTVYRHGIPCPTLDVDTARTKTTPRHAPATNLDEEKTNTLATSSGSTSSNSIATTPFECLSQGLFWFDRVPVRKHMPFSFGGTRSTVESDRRLWEQARVLCGLESSTSHFPEETTN